MTAVIRRSPLARGAACIRATLKVLILALLVAGCAGGALWRDANERFDDYLSHGGPPVDSFRFFRLYGWQAVGPTQLVIWSSAFDAYLVTVQEPCPRLEFVQRIGVTSTNETVSTLESIVLKDHERCPINQIRPIDLKRMNADRAAQRAAAKANATSDNPR